MLPISNWAPLFHCVKRTECASVFSETFNCDLDGAAAAPSGLGGVAGPSPGCGAKIEMWAGSRRGARTFAEHCGSTLEQGTKALNAQSPLSRAAFTLTPHPPLMIACVHCMLIYTAPSLGSI